MTCADGTVHRLFGVTMINADRDRCERDAALLDQWASCGPHRVLPVNAPRFRGHPYTCGVYDPPIYEGGRCDCGADVWNAALTACGVTDGGQTDE